MTRSLALVLFLAACSGGDGAVQPPPPEADDLRLVEVAGGLESPVYVTAPPGDARLFIVEQPGRIRVVENGSLLATAFLDIAGLVGSGGERGLLSIAFHPQYAQNGFVYVNYTDRAGDTRVERYRASADRNRADPASARLVIGIAQPFSNHNGGQLQFGPDGKLYVGMGDGGSAGDPDGHGQNPATLLGDILRLDVDAGPPYAVPADNPFAGQAGRRGEIWIMGVRNPWRFSFDRETGQMYVADVGQGQWEEVHVSARGEGGLNFGWNTMEGTHCFRPATGCDRRGLTLPVLEYSHADGACSVTGGYMYRGSDIPGLRGHYFYGDFCAGWVRSFRHSGGEAVDRREWEVGDVGNILTFGEDAEGELYLGSTNGRVYRFAPAP